MMTRAEQYEALLADEERLDAELRQARIRRARLVAEWVVQGGVGQGALARDLGISKQRVSQLLAAAREALLDLSPSPAADPGPDA